MAFSPDGKTLATGDYNISTYLWGIDGGRRRRGSQPALMGVSP